MDAIATAPEEDQKTSFSDTVNYVKDLFTTGPQSLGVEMGIGAVLARTALKRLPAPLNVVVPIAVEKVILKYGIPEGREVLLKGLRWIKKATDEDLTDTE